MGYSRLLSALRIWHYHQDVICILINSIVLHNSNKNTHSYFLTMSNLNVNRIEFSIAGLSFGNIPQSLWLMSPELTTPGQDTIFFDFAAKRFYSADRTIGIWPFSHRFFIAYQAVTELSVFESRFYKLSTLSPEKTLHYIYESILPILLSLQDEETGRGHSASSSCFVALYSRLSSR